MLQDLPDVLLALDGNIQLPEQLRDDVEAVQVEGGPAALEQELQHLRELRKENGEDIQLHFVQLSLGFRPMVRRSCF